MAYSEVTEPKPGGENVHTGGTDYGVSELKQIREGSPRGVHDMRRSEPKQGDESIHVVVAEVNIHM